MAQDAFDSISKYLNSTQDTTRENASVVVLILLLIGNGLVRALFPTRKQALVSGAGIGFTSVILTATKIKRAAEALQDKDVWEEVKKGEVAYGLGFANKLALTIASTMVSSLANILVLTPYSKKRIREAIEDMTPMSLYITAGFIGGFLAGLIYVYKIIKLTKDDIILLLKKLPSAIKAQVEAFSKQSGKAKAITIVLLYILAVLIKSRISDLINAIRRKKVVEPKPAIVKEPALLKAATAYYLTRRYGKKVSIKSLIKPKITAKISYSNVKPLLSNEELLLDDRKLRPREKVVLAVKLLKSRAEKAGLRLNVKQFYIARDYEFNAFYNPIMGSITIIDDSRVIRALTAREIAAILAHECGHVYNDMYGKLVNSISLALELITLLVFALNKDFILNKFKDITTHSELLLLEASADFALSSWLRLEEISADAFAIKLGLGQDLAEAFRKFGFHKETDIIYASDEHDIPSRRVKAIEEVLQELSKDKDFNKLIVK